MLCENDESMKCVLPTLLRLACTAYEENIDDDGKFFQVVVSRIRIDCVNESEIRRNS